MGQDSYSQSITAKRAGMPADFHSKMNGDVVTGVNEKAVAIFPGRFVVKGTDDNHVKIQDSGAAISTGLYIGLAVDISARERASGSSLTAGYPINAQAPVARSGRWYAEAEEAVDKGGTVYVRFAAGTGPDVIGKVRSDADETGGVGEDEVTAEAVKAKFAETISAAGLVAIELNIAQV